jgi:hypothetical protein
VNDAQDTAAAALGLPPIEMLLAELDKLKQEQGDLAPRRRIRDEVIPLLAEMGTGAQQDYRDALVKAEYIKSRDFTSCLSEAKRAAQQRDREQERAQAVSSSYRQGDDGCLYVHIDGIPVLVARFIPQVTAEIVKDDGAERIRVIRIRVTLPNGRSGEVDVTPEKLRDSRVWSVQAAGPAAAIAAISRAAEHVLAAAQIFGEDHDRSEIYSHTGWRQLAGTWRFLTASGALGAAGLDTSVTVDLGSDVLNRYRLPDPSAASTEEIQAAVRASLALRSIGPLPLTVPLFAAGYRAALPLHPDCAVWMTGLSGLGKTALAALAQQHFGAEMDAKSLPGNWASTGNALEGTAFSLANVLMVVDDYNPQGSERDQAAMRQAAERLIRGSANAAGRGRQRRDGTPAPQRFARAQILATAEDTPPGHSLRARMFMTEAESDLIKGIADSRAQDLAAQGVYALAMAGYVQWIASRLDQDPGFPAALQRVRNEFRTKLTTEGQHRRVPEAAASLLLGWGTFLRFAEEIHALSADESKSIYTEAEVALTDVAREQSGRQRDSEPPWIYCRALATAITTGAAYFADLSHGGAPANPSRWGWRETQGPHGVPDIRPGAKRIGWVSEGQVYVAPGPAYEVAVEHARKAGTPVSFGEIAIRKRLNEAGFLVTTGGGKNLGVQLTIPGGGRARLLHLDWDKATSDEAQR